MFWSPAPASEITPTRASPASSMKHRGVRRGTSNPKAEQHEDSRLESMGSDSVEFRNQWSLPPFSARGHPPVFWLFRSLAWLPQVSGLDAEASMLDSPSLVTYQSKA